jgi:uncharacterized protein
MAKEHRLKDAESMVKKKTGKSKRNKSTSLNRFKKIVILIVALIAVCLALAIIANLFFQPDKPSHSVKERISRKPEAPSEEPSIIQAIPEDIIVHEKEKSGTTPAQKQTERQQPPPQYEIFKDTSQRTGKKPIFKIKDNIPRIAIIIDDIGYNNHIVNKLIDLDANITFAILPFSPFGKKISKQLYSVGAEIMLHLPMEPVSYPKADPGPGVLFSDMAPDVLLEQLKNNLNDIPHIIGVNNHMGSELCTHTEQMNRIFSLLKKNNLFYIDSRTASGTKAWYSARLLKLRFAQRDIFLDNDRKVENIIGQINKLVRLAHKDGYAIGIGHPYKSTLQALSMELPKLKNELYFVRASELTAVPE